MQAGTRLTELAAKPAIPSCKGDTSMPGLASGTPALHVKRGGAWRIIIGSSLEIVGRT